MKLSRQSTINEVMQTDEAKRLYKLLENNFDSALKDDRKLAEAIHRKATFLGSQLFFERIIWQFLTESEGAS